MGVDVNTLHQEFKSLLGEKNVVLVSGRVRNNVKLNLGFVTRDISQEIINWWSSRASSIVGNRSTKANLDREEVTDTIELEDGEVVHHFSRRTDLVLRFVDRSGEMIEINEYRLSICI